MRPFFGPQVESQFPAWVSQFLLRDGGTRTGLLQREEMQAQLQKLESKILTHVAEMQGKSAREAVASLGLKLQKEGVVGVTEEVRNCAPRTPISTHTPSPPSRGAIDLQSHTASSLVWSRTQVTCRRLRCLLWGWNGRVGRWHVCRDTSVLQAEEGSVCGALALALGSEGGLACRLSQLLWVPVSGRTPHCEPGPEALQ